MSLSLSLSLSLVLSSIIYPLLSFVLVADGERDERWRERERERFPRDLPTPLPSLCSLLCEELEGCRRADAKSDQRRNLSGRNAFVGPLRDEEIEASTSFSLFSFFLFSDWLNWI